ESLSPEEAEVKKDEKVSEGLDELTDKLVEHADAKQEQKPAIPKDSFDADAALEEELGLQENDTEMLQAAAEEATDTNKPENSETA
ncbi:EcsC family protein, partial [Acinetobacter schindleri]